MAYPSTIDSPGGIAAQGTSLLTSIDHAQDHRILGSAVVAVENKVGIGPGSAAANLILVGTALGNSNWQQTWNNGTLQSPTINGQGTNSGTLANGVYGTSTFKGGTIDASTITNGIITNSNNTVSFAAFTNPYKFYVYRNAALNTGSAAFSVVTFDTKVFDTGSNVDIATNKGRFTAPISGFYQFNARVSSNGSNIAIIKIALYKNGSEVIRGDDNEPSGSPIPLASARVSALLQLTATDYVEVYCYGDSAKAIDVGSAITNYFQGYLVSVT